MTKLCSVCSTENRDEAQFCRACGSAFATAQAAGNEDPSLADGVTCDECGFQNKPGIRYCANCGVSLLGTVIVPRSRGTTAPAAHDPHTSLSPPPISYTSFAPVGPYPPAPSPPFLASEVQEPAPQTAADPGAVRYDEPLPPDEPPADHTPFATPAPARNHTPLILAAVAVLLVAGGAAAWWSMSGPSRAVAPAVAASAAASPAAQAPIPVEPPVAAVPADAPVAAVPPSAATTLPASNLPPAAAAPLPQVGDAVAPDADAEAKRVAAEKARRDKAAKEKVEREAKAKALAEQRDKDAAAAARADQEAQARRRTEEAPRPRPVVSAPVAPPVPAPAQARGVREICAGRGTIAESICQSRECGRPEHAAEALCRQVREAEDRRRNYQN